ncbi:MAG TPA: type II toxin-antitoxin system VapC family toxin [Microbacterium sp.]|uniref:type II toxin-antitoxin system VapC family toxin n=1 Tax=Microbacterium sp. TaxID=51671 RepID=UPI002C13704B|nr:type II toxin-antitoxin system VapC family toxin [Microbacterium sp.]HWI31377.1 type II toxin-antitoxin system VapC family toxin [Microbacterium sp.]
MVRVAYLDASAAMKLVLDEPESAALVDALASDPDRWLAAGWLLHTEMHCAAGRHPDAFDLDAIRGVLDVVNLVDLTRGDMIAAGTHAPLRSNDAIHLAVAIRLGVDEIVTYDSELADAAARAGLAVLAPA